jgi:D-beta-D-heptose 7-phosphate kinase/D-beta-D-heptose 1-phosphate adenosyltransferase
MSLISPMRIELNNLISVVAKLAGARVLCIGDLMLDRFVYGSVERISPEGPIPIIHVEKEATMLGGAGNVVRNVVALGAQCTFVSAIGTDDGGKRLTTLVSQLKNVEAYLLRESGRISTIKTRYMADGQQLLRADEETDVPLAPATESDIRLAALDAIPSSDAVILSDYGKGVLSDSVIQCIIKKAQVEGKPIIVDPKGNDFSRYAGATFVTPNNSELALASGQLLGDDGSIIEAVRKLIVDHEIDSFLVTRSQEGMSLINLENVNHIPVRVKEVFDVSGAGDTVVAVFSSAVAVGIRPTDAAHLANVAAGLVVGKLGTAAVNLNDLRRAMRNDGMETDEDKIVSPMEATERAEGWRKNGKVVGFTNGCFDILHPGHVSMLRQARSLCDHLIVGLNSDESVRRLKGEDRPVQTEGARAYILASLPDVDLVVTFSDNTPESLIGELAPDVLIKGADYRREDVVGADLVERAGGKVMLIELEPGYSTTATIAKIVSRNNG